MDAVPRKEALTEHRAFAGNNRFVGTPLLYSISAKHLYERGVPRADQFKWAGVDDDGAFELRLGLIEGYADGSVTRYHGDRKEVYGCGFGIDWSTVPSLASRGWVICQHCQKRCNALFVTDGLKCRTCAGLRYSSTFDRRTPFETRAERAKAIRVQLGAPPVLFLRTPERPARMHRRTYEKLLVQLAGLEAEILYRANWDIERAERAVEQLQRLGDAAEMLTPSERARRDAFAIYVRQLGEGRERQRLKRVENDGDG